MDARIKTCFLSYIRLAAGMSQLPGPLIMRQNAAKLTSAGPVIPGPGGWPSAMIGLRIHNKYNRIRKRAEHSNLGC